MRTTIDRIEADKILVADQLRRLGIAPRRILRVVLETVDHEEISVTAMNAAGGAFDYLDDEPDLYTDADLIEPHDSICR